MGVTGIVFDNSSRFYSKRIGLKTIVIYNSMRFHLLFRILKFAAFYCNILILDHTSQILLMVRAWEIAPSLSDSYNEFADFCVDVQVWDIHLVTPKALNILTFIFDNIENLKRFWCIQLNSLIVLYEYVGSWAYRNDHVTGYHDV